MFSDESRFNLSVSDGRVKVWRRRGERFADRHIDEVDAYGRGSVMVWAGISIGGKTELVFIEGNLNSRRYIDEILAPHVVPYAGAIGESFVLQDDNARPHRGIIVNEYLENQGITRMDWPAVSPDLNPIEHLWDILGRRATPRLNPDSTLNDIRAILLEEWQQIPQLQVDRLINSMRRRCTECIEAEGGLTHY